MMQIDYNPKNQTWVINATVRDTYDIKEIPGARASRKMAPEQARWTVPATIGAAYQIAADLPQAEWTDAALDERAELAEKRKRRMRIKRGDISWPKVATIGGKLSELQRVGVRFLLEGSGILADDMGSGKTVQASVAAACLGAQETLVLTTVSTLNVWAEHLREWGHIEPFIFHGPGRAKAYAEYVGWEGPKALISTHALMQKHSARASFGHVAADGAPGEFNEHYDLCIVDEAHKAGLDPKRPGLRALHRIGHNCDVRWALTGTPINTSPDETWNLMAFVEPDVLMDRGAFRRRLCIMVDRGFGSPINEGIHPDRIEEYDFLVQPYFLRRLKREVWADLPAALPPQYIRLPLTDKQSALYRKVVKDGVARVDTGVVAAVDDLALTQVCQYIANGMPEVDEDGRVTGLTAPSNKLTYMLEMMEERGRDNPVVVYSYSTKVTALLEAGLIKAGWRVNTVDGSTTRKMRDAIVKAFQSYSLDVLLITDAGAEGLTLTAADTVVFVMESWSARTNQQVRDRIDRIGQTKETSTIVLVSEGTVEESRRKSVADKVDHQQLVLRDKVELSSFLNGTWDPVFS